MTYLTKTYPTIFLLRHGRTEWNVEGRLQGHLDSPLTPLGLSQAEAQRQIIVPVLQHFPDIHADASPLGRAWQTAQIALDGHLIHPHDGLREVNAGDWEGRLRNDIAAENGMSGREEDMFELFLNAPNGEGAQALEQRCLAYLGQLTGPTIIVSHGVVSAFLRGVLQGLEFEAIAKLAHLQGVVTAIAGGRETVLRTQDETRAYLDAG